MYIIYIYIYCMYILYIELSKRVTRPNSTRSATGWSLSESIQPGSFISEPKKLEPDMTHHGVAG